MTNSKSIYALFSISIIGLIFQYGLQAFLAHGLGSHFYGEYNIALRFLAIFVTISLLGTDAGAQAFLAKYLKSHNIGRTKQYLSWNIKLISISFLISRLLAIAIIATVTTIHLLDISSIYNNQILLSTLWITPIAATFRLVTNFLISNNCIFQSFILTNVVYLIIQFVFFFTAINVFKLQLHNLGIIIVLGFSYLLLSLIALVLLKKKFLTKIWYALLELKTTPLFNKEWGLTSTRLTSNNLLYIIYVAVDLIVIKLVSKNEIDVAYYAAAQSIAAFIWVLPGNLYLKLKPTISHAIQTNNGQRTLQKALKHINKIAFTICIILSILLLYFSGPLLLLFGPNYIQAQPALIYLLIGGLCTSFFQSGYYVLIYGGFEGFVCLTSLAQLSCMFIFMIPATHWFGITGTAIVKTTISIMTYIVCTIYVKKKLNINIISV